MRGEASVGKGRGEGTANAPPSPLLLRYGVQVLVGPLRLSFSLPAGLLVDLADVVESVQNDRKSVNENHEEATRRKEEGDELDEECGQLHRECCRVW